MYGGNTKTIAIPIYTVLPYCVIFNFLFLKDGHTVYPINSQISSKLWHAEAVESMMSYFKRDHLFQFSYWLVPVHLGAHWAMMVNKLMRNFMCRKQMQNILHEVCACLKSIV